MGDRRRNRRRGAPDMTYRGMRPPISEGDGQAENVAGRPRLLEAVRSRLRLKHYSLRTEQA